MIQKKKNILRYAVSLLLLSILPVNAAYELVSIRHPEKSAKTVLFTPALMEGENSPALFNQRAKFNSFDELFKHALIEQTSIDPTREYISFLFESGTCFAQYAGQAKIAIRAPPCLNI